MIYPNWSLTIGVITTTFGLRGEVKVHIETDFPERFEKLKEVCVRPPSGEARLFAITSVRFHKTQALLKLKGVERIEEAELLRGSLLQVKKTDAMPLPDNEFYIHDLVGCEVQTDSGRVLGTLTSVLRNSANDVYIIGQGKGEILLPAIKQVVQEVNLAEKRIVVTLLPGLLPEDAEEIRG